MVGLTFPATEIILNFTTGFYILRNRYIPVDGLDSRYSTVDWVGTRERGWRVDPEEGQWGGGGGSGLKRYVSTVVYSRWDKFSIKGKLV